MMDQKPRSKVILEETLNKPAVPVTDSIEFEQKTLYTTSLKPTITPKTSRSGRIVRLADRFMFLEKSYEAVPEGPEAVYIVVGGLSIQLTNS